MDFKTKMTRMIGKMKLKTEKNAPDILLGLGIASFVGTFAMTIRGTIKAGDVLEIHGAKMRDIQDEVEKAEEEPLKYEYPAELLKQDKARVYAYTGLGMTKAYAPAVGMMVISIGCIMASRNILQKRYLAAVAAYESVSTAFNAYRGRVIEEKGEMWDRHYMYGTKIEEITETVIDPETGKKKKVTKEVEVIDTDDYINADVSRWFGPDNYNWSPHVLVSRAFLNAQSTMLTDMLNFRGHVFLNEVYDSLGYEHTPEGALLGWIINDDEMGVIDLGLFEYNRPGVKEFADGDANEILLTFPGLEVIFNRI